MIRQQSVVFAWSDELEAVSDLIVCTEDDCWLQTPAAHAHAAYVRPALT